MRRDGDHDMDVIRRDMPLQDIDARLPTFFPYNRPHPLHMGRAAKVITIVGFAEPPPLTGRFAGSPAGWLGTVVLPSHIAGVRIKESPTVLALALSHRTCHGPASPQVHDRPMAVWLEENG